MTTPNEADARLDFMQFRIEYSQKSLSERDVAADPIRQFRNWLDEAIAAKAHEPNVMTLATATRDGIPSARIVLLKDVDDRGFSFFTNYQSQKGQELESNPRAALVFYWAELERQVRIDGRVERTSTEESDQYFSRRPALARIGSAASPQSRVVPNRRYLEDRFSELEARHPDGNIPRPSHWGGYRVIPHRFEFWQGRPSRLHDRIEYVIDAGRWVVRRVAP
jgi:pyridoxamine 5'-phosphate oxidase